MEIVLKKFYLLALMLIIALSFTSAQNISVVDSAKLWFEFETPLTMPKLSPDGKLIAFSEDNLRDLYVSSTDTIIFQRSVKAKSAGWQFRWSPNSEYIVTTGKPLDFNSPYDDTYLYLVRSNGKVDTLVKSVDEIGLPFVNQSGTKIYYQLEGKATKEISLSENSGQTPYALFSNETLVIGGIAEEKINFIPQSIENKVILFLEWSPDYSKLAVHYAGLGIVVYDLNTKQSYQFPRSEYPSWLNNEYLVFMKVIDDGLKFIDADVYCAKFDNTIFANLSAKFPGMVFYPFASSDGTIVFVDQSGRVFKMKIKID